MLIEGDNKEFNQKEDIHIMEEQTYRSQPFVNMNNDRVRVVLTLPIRKWRRVKKFLKDV